MRNQITDNVTINKLSPYKNSVLNEIESLTNINIENSMFCSEGFTIFKINFRPMYSWHYWFYKVFLVISESVSHSNLVGDQYI